MPSMPSMSKSSAGVPPVPGLPAAFVERPMKLVPTLSILPPPFPTKYLQPPKAPEVSLLPSSVSNNPVKKASLDFKDLVHSEVVQMKQKLQSG